MLDNRESYIWDTMVELGIATNEELGLAVALCGTTEQTLNRVLFIRTGYRSIEQMLDEEQHSKGCAITIHSRTTHRQQKHTHKEKQRDRQREATTPIDKVNCQNNQTTNRAKKKL